MMHKPYCHRRAVLVGLGSMILTPVQAFAESDTPSEFGMTLSRAAIERTRHTVRYDGSYRRIDYPGGDVPDTIGVCTDLVIRAYRVMGIDLQKRVYEDMRGNFAAYPQRWGLSEPDTNIDHRRVPNLRRYFERRGTSLPVSDDLAAWRTGDLATWILPGNLPHIGIVTHRISPSRRPMIAHNIGAGPELEDMLTAYPLTGHYRYPAA